jgi:hypothetical protein
LCCKLDIVIQNRVFHGHWNDVKIYYKHSRQAIRADDATKTLNDAPQLARNRCINNRLLTFRRR